ncbi:hypothetical protein [Streptomyces sp. CC224B]|uniref:hypothetical protein n=1 Tax=Streptomyces sp. CC224B TaxID=3044571 RepID=UPI0024A8DA26|nr:hypothetical protein [Streptomyces sp. CC224B]
MPERPELLTEREEGMLIMRARGYTFAEIGPVYGVGGSRAHQIIKGACQALGASDPAHAIGIALCAGLITVEDLSGSDGNDRLGEMRIPEHVREAVSGVGQESRP